MPGVIRHLLAPVLPAAARALELPRTLPDGAGVALSFDDGPHPEGTPSVLEVLSRASARATFFLIGEQVERRPALAAEIAAAGHVVALHGYRHRLQVRLSPSAVREDLARGAAAIEDAVGAAPAWHRPPYGVYSPAGLRAVHGAALRPLLWSRWGKDWRRFTTPGRIAARATRHVSRGDIILLHDADFYSSHGSHRKTVQALPLVIAELRRRELDTVLPG
ncbi:MAG: polysaccharide deacetylase family protein [Solirubrobacterales bacterium]|nr:polysaccharide deacetylase family protein [Solirubrobacterales bacterium]MBV9424308.1 polysaccharide deacetylase family protein [Solirubrobacterales bacterium]